MKTGNIVSEEIDGLMQVVYDSGELATAATTVTISGLNGNTDGEYQLIVRLVNDYDGDSGYFFRFNNDSGINYGYQYVLGNNTDKTAGRGSNGNISLNSNSADTICMSSNLISAKSGYVRTVLSDRVDAITGTTVNTLISIGQVWNNTADNITSLAVLADQADGIGVGSRIILLRKVTATTGMKTGVLEVQGTVKNAWQEIYKYTQTGEAQQEFSATGGTVTNDGDDYTHTFTSDGTLTVIGSGDLTSVECWGGGGGGGGSGSSQGGGGGGGGEYSISETVAVTAGNYPIIVGLGGAGGGGIDHPQGDNGSSSKFNNTTVVANGGSGSPQYSGGSGGTGGTGDQKYNGGAGRLGGTSFAFNGGGGGGSGGDSSNGNSATSQTGATAVTGGGNGGNGGDGGSSGTDGSSPTTAPGGGGGGGGAPLAHVGGGGLNGKVVVKYTKVEPSGGVTSLTISGLTGNTDVLYRLRTRIVNGYNGASGYYLRPNNDTGTNYGYQYLQGINTDASCGRGTFSAIVSLGSASALNLLTQSEYLIYAKSGYVRCALGEMSASINGTTINTIQLNGQSWNNTADEITSLVILADQTNGIGVGSEIVLERLNL